jgi:DNA-binding response OmpR family regulator
VVDDELPICNMLKSFLSNLGYSVITACDGEMALKKYTTAKIRPHAIILDVGLPKMSGLECLGLLRDFDPKAKVLIATGYGGDNIETEARKNGASCLLAKPYKLTELGQTLRNVLDANGTN